MPTTFISVKLVEEVGTMNLLVVHILEWSTRKSNINVNIVHKNSLVETI